MLEPPVAGWRRASVFLSFFNTEINYEALYEASSPCSEASIALMIACMAQASDFLKKLTAQYSATGKNILILKDRSLLSTFVYQALVPMKLHLVQDIWNAYSSLVQGDWASGCVLLDADESVANARHEKDCHYDANTKQILSCYRLVPAVFGMSREQYFNFVSQTNKPREISNRLYEVLNERSRLALMSRIPKYYTINTAECDQTETTQRAAKKINEWISQHQ